VDYGNPRAPRRQASAELTRSVREGRKITEALRALDARAALPDKEDRALADELARFLVRRCSERHQGWQVLTQVLQDAGVEVSWSRAERQAYAPAAERVLSDCAGPGRTPVVRVQHAAAEERARALASHLDAADTLGRLSLTGPEDPEAWEAALVAAVRARSRDQALGLLSRPSGRA